MNATKSLVMSIAAVLALVLIAMAGVKWAHLYGLFGVAFPYVGIATFFIGIIYRVVDWGKSPVPFRIALSCGQQRSLPWLKHSWRSSPFTRAQAFIRLVDEVLIFRSLLMNRRLAFGKGEKIAHRRTLLLWGGAIIFHYTMLVIFIRHQRFFIEPVPWLVRAVEGLDRFLEFPTYSIYASGVLFLLTLIYLLLRRIFDSRLRYISLPSDYFPLMLLLGIAGSGTLMRYWLRVDLVAAKALFIGIFALRPAIPGDIGTIFYVHLFLVSILLAYIPFSKLIHGVGLLFSPTRNLPNNSRAVRHVNPWNPQPPFHSYEEYEDEFREKMKEAGLPVDKE